jgi:pimeloyl-ACP methyl ester carboxylesterase
MRIIGKTLLALSALLVVAALAFIGANWAPDQPASALAGKWAQPPSRFLDLRGMKVHIRDQGPRTDPTPLILIHGTSASLHTWDGWATLLAPTRRVITMDLPGFGLTGPSPDQDYTPEAYARFITQLMDALAIQHAILAGNSLGGGIAWVTAVTAPDRVAKLILIDSVGFPETPIAMPIGFRLASQPWLAPLFNHILPRGIIQASLQSVYANPSLVTPALVDEYFDMTTRAGNREALTQHMGETDFTALQPRIATIKQPTLILWGAEDRLIPPANAALFHQAIAGSVMVILPNLGHVPQEENPAASLAAARAFIDAP